MILPKIYWVTPFVLSCCVYADFVWQGGENITQDLWQTSASWNTTNGTTFPSTGTGPNTANSNAWAPIQISNASGSITALDGWNLQLTLGENTHLTVGQLGKFQSNSNCSVTIAVGSSLTVNNFSGGNDGGDVIINNQGTITMAYAKSQGGNGFQTNLGSTGKMIFTSQDNNAFTVSMTTLTAQLTSNGGTVTDVTTAGNEIRTWQLVSLGANMSFAAAPTVTITSDLNGTQLTELAQGQTLTDAAAGTYQIISNEQGIKVSFVSLDQAPQADLIWTGENNAGTWSTTEQTPSPWQNGTQFSDNKSVQFGDVEGNAPQTVTIAGTVNPGSITVNAGATDYTWQSQTGSNDNALTGNATLTKRGNATLSIQTDNSNYTGNVILRGGVLEMANANALGSSGTINFSGGTLKYGTGITGDISDRIAADSDGPIQVNTNGNNVTWATDTVYKTKPLVKSGTGTLTLNQTSYTGALTVNEGGVTIPTGNTIVSFAGGVNVAQNATLSVTSTATGHDTSNYPIQITGIHGAGTITLDDQQADSRFIITGDNTDFTGTLQLKGVNNTPNASNPHDVYFANVAAMGNGTIQIDGRGFYINTNNSSATNPIRANIHLDTKGAFLNGGSGNTYYFDGTFTGTGELTTGLGATAVLTGNLSNFNGGFNRSSGSNTFTWQFGNNGVVPLGENNQLFGDNVTLKGNAGTQYKFAYTNDTVVMNATVAATGSATTNINLLQSGTGTLVLSQDNPSTGTLTIENGSVQLGNGESTGQWKGVIAGTGNLIINRSSTAAAVELAVNNTYSGGTTLASGTTKTLGANSLGTGAVTINNGAQLDLNNQAVNNAITITDGSLQNARTYAVNQGVTINADADANNIALGGLDGSKINTITTAGSDTIISGLSGNLTLQGNNTLWLGSGNTNYNGQTATALLQFNNTTTDTLTLSDAGLTVNINIATDLLAAMRTQDSVQIALTNATIAGAPFPTDSKELTEWLNQRITFNEVLSQLGFLVTDIEGGNITISGHTDAIYIATEDGTTVNSLVELAPYRQVIVNSNMTMDLTVPQDNTQNAVIHQLSSGNNGTTGNLNITAIGTGTLDIELTNDIQNTTFNGITTVRGDNTVNLIKTGEHDLTLTGNVSTPYAVIAREGDLNLNGTNTIATLTLDSTNTANPAQVTVGGTTTVQTVTEGTNAGSLSINGTLSTSGNSILSNTELSGTGTLNVQQNASLAVEKNSTFVGTLDLDGSLTLGAAAIATTHSAKTLTGEETATLALNNSTLILNGTNVANFAGNLSGSGTLVLDGTTQQTLQGNGEQNTVQVNSTATLNLLSKNDTSLNYNAIETQGKLRLTANETANTTLTLTDGIVFKNDSDTEFVYNLDSAGTVLVQAGAITIEDTAHFSISSLASNTTLGDFQNLTAGVIIMSTQPTVTTFSTRAAVALAADTGVTGLDEERSITLSGLPYVYYSDAAIRKEGGNVVLYATERNDNLFAPFADTNNALAGADLIWDTRKLNTVATDPRAQVMEAISQLTQSTTPNRGEINRLLAAMAGSTIPALGTAQRVAMGDQMLRLRNKMTYMGADQLLLHDDYPHVHMWIEGLGGYTDIQSKGDEAGYRLDTWGGSVGFDTDLNDHWTIGAALTVEYGDLNAHGAEEANGELNGYYLNLFVRYKNNRFANSIMLTGGLFNASLDRTVQFDTDGYTASGSTNGQGLGVMYELTYDTYLTDERDVILQPLLNLSFITTSMDTYTESGAGNAGLQVSKQDWSVGTAALGLRLTGTLGSNLFGRPVIGELRANIAQDMGDDRGEVDVAFADAPLVTQSVRGVKVGSTGVQFGVGLHMPVGTQNAVFIHGNADVRSGRNSYSAVLGWRYDF